MIDTSTKNTSKREHTEAAPVEPSADSFEKGGFCFFPKPHAGSSVRRFPPELRKSSKSRRSYGDRC
jgi:hypothetical protein